MKSSQSKKFNVICMIREHVSTHPGTNMGQTATALAAHFTPNYVQAKIRQMIAKEQLRAEISPLNRYSLYIPDQTPEQEPTV